MAKFTVTLFSEGTRVRAVAGEHKGRVGIIAGWRRIEADHPDPLHVIRLDEAIAVPARTAGNVLQEPEHQIDTIEAKTSELEEA